MLHRSPFLLGLAALAVTLPAQDDFAAFRTTIEASLRQHPFFSRISFTLVERPPFLFCVERSANDAKDHELGVVNSYLPFLREVMAQFEEHYKKPAGLVRSAAAGGYAMAVLNSAGRYVDFRTAIGDPSLAMARAHYTPSLRLAVTYQDTFARYNTNPEERHALLHEFLHALQHAHAAGDKMPVPVWFNEGLADYRASGTNIAASLREPPVQSNHVAAMAFGYGNPAGRFYVAPIADLVAANSYKDVVDLAGRRNGAALPQETVLSMFYAQAEMFVRFLHEGEQGKHRSGFVKYLAAAQQGASGLLTFQSALGVATPGAMSALEQEWLRWLDGVLRIQYPKLPDLSKGAAAAPPGAAVPMPPPSAFDASGLAWTKADVTDRLAGVRRLCARGEYEAGLALLPDEADLSADERAFAQRERARVAALIQLRDDVLADLVQKNGHLTATTAAGPVKGRVLRSAPEGVVVMNGKVEVVVPREAITPAVLIGEGRRLKRFVGKGCWLEVWARWLKGDPRKALLDLLALDYPTLPDLRADLIGDCDANFGAPAAALLDVMRLPPTEDAEQARGSLQRLRQLVAAHRHAPLFLRRKAALDKLVRAHAERAFRLDDIEGLGVHGVVTKPGSGAIQVEYGGTTLPASADFTALTAAEREAVPQDGTKITWAGASGLSVVAGGYHLVGSTWLRWPVGLSGQQVVELEFIVRGDFVPDFGIAIGARDGRMMLVRPTGSVQVFDPDNQVFDAIGGGAQLVRDQAHRLRIEHDGKKTLRVAIDGKATATVADVGKITGGDVLLAVHSSSPVFVTRLVICGVPDPGDPGQLRERFVRSVLESLWP